MSRGTQLEPLCLLDKRRHRVMDNRALAATVAGAVIGGAAGYLFFTDRGRSLRRQIEPALDDIARELSHFRGTVNKAAGVATEGWKLLNEALGEREYRYPTTHQPNPFSGRHHGSQLRHGQS